MVISIEWERSKQILRLCFLTFNGAVFHLIDLLM